MPPRDPGGECFVPLLDSVPNFGFIGLAVVE
jgi:hypothetical protein